MVHLINLFFAFYATNQNLSCRWDESAVYLLPEYLKKFYIELLMAFKNIDGELPIDMVYDTSHLKRAVTINKFYQNTKIYHKLSQSAICRDLYSFDMPYHIKNPSNNLHCHGKKWMKN
jgi:hypothetical protein